MKDETLLDIATYNFRAALKCYLYSSGDEREINTTGYLLQQSVELAIKHFIEMSGVKYQHTNSIEDLLDSCDLNNVTINFTDEFYNFAPAITKWKSKSRYIKNYLLSKRQVETGFKMIKEFLLSNGVKEEELKLPEIKINKMTLF